MNNMFKKRIKKYKNKKMPDIPFEIIPIIFSYLPKKQE